MGQKNKITRRWATKRGTRPTAPKDQRTQSAYIFGAICPAEGEGAGVDRNARHGLREPAKDEIHGALAAGAIRAL